MEQPQEEVAVKGKKTILAFLPFHHVEAVTQIISITVKKALFLDEGHKHQTIEHERSVPFTVSLRLNSLDELEERCMFALEALIKTLGNTVHIKRGSGSAGDVNDGQMFFFLKTKSDGVEF